MLILLFKQISVMDLFFLKEEPFPVLNSIFLKAKKRKNN